MRETDKIPVQRDEWPQLWLRHRDQLCIALVATCGLCLLLGSFAWRHFMARDMVDIRHATAVPPEFQVDINAATWQEFAMLPDIGDTLAKRIVAWRDQHGSFESVDQLRQVRGIGPKTLAGLKPFLLPVPTSLAACKNELTDETKSVEP